MAQARQRGEWDRAAHLMCLLANLHRDPGKGRSYTPADFHPFPEDTPPIRRVRPRRTVEVDHLDRWFEAAGGR